MVAVDGAVRCRMRTGLYCAPAFALRSLSPRLLGMRSPRVASVPVRSQDKWISCYAQWPPTHIQVPLEVSSHWPGIQVVPPGGGIT
jgi:hypothetical protein